MKYIWHSIKYPPKTSGDYIVGYKLHNLVFTAYYDWVGKVWYAEYFKLRRGTVKAKDITHWTHKPNLPK